MTNAPLVDNLKGNQMLSTGPVETWQSNPTELGPLYPLVGAETIMFVASLVVFVAFLVWKFKSEQVKYDQQAKDLIDQAR